MEAFLSYFIYFTIVVVFNIIEYKRCRTVINPFFFLSIPFTIIMLICVAFNKAMYFVPFNPLCLNLWSVGLVIFWIGGATCEIIIKKAFPESGVCDEKRSLYAGVNDKSLINIIFGICILFSMLLTLKSGSSGDFASKEMGDEVGKGGIAGRISNVLILAVPYYFGYKCKPLKRIGVILLLMMLITAIGSKTWLTYSLVAGFVTMGFTGMKINPKTIIIGGLVLLLVFVLYYRLNTGIEDNDHFMEFVARHFYFYITSGILPLSEIIDKNMEFHGTGMTHPFVKLFMSWIDPSSFSFHSKLWITTDLFLGTQSNVCTFFGNFYTSGGMKYVITNSFYSGLLCYFFRVLYLRSNSIFLASSYALTLAVLFFGWFNYGLGLERIWEIYIISFILYYLSKYKFSIYGQSYGSIFRKFHSKSNSRNRFVSLNNEK
ncbi:MAG: oligosaccharide repeat unit polymerase [Clostridiales bacterium]|nr:oligosaccharide repeat unit polymerase [Clostridiales bacterium]